MSKQLPPPQPRPWQESLATLAARALIALVLVLIVGNIFNADHAFFKFGPHRDTLRQASVYGILAYGLTLVIVSGVFAHRRGQRRLVGPGDGAAAGAALHRHPRSHGAGARRGGVCFRGHEGLHGGAECRWHFQLRGRVGSVSWDRHPHPRRQRFHGHGHLRGLGGGGLVHSFKAGLGRCLHATGNNEQAARFSGVPFTAAKAGAYVASGVFAAVAGLCQAAQEQQGDPEERLERTVIIEAFGVGQRHAPAGEAVKQLGDIDPRGKAFALVRARIKRRFPTDTILQIELLEQRRNGQLPAMRAGLPLVTKLDAELPGFERVILRHA